MKIIVGIRESLGLPKHIRLNCLFTNIDRHQVVIE